MPKRREGKPEGRKTRESSQQATSSLSATAFHAAERR